MLEEKRGGLRFRAEFPRMKEEERLWDRDVGGSKSREKEGEGRSQHQRGIYLVTEESLKKRVGKKEEFG